MQLIFNLYIISFVRFIVSMHLIYQVGCQHLVDVPGSSGFMTSIWSNILKHEKFFFLGLGNSTRTIMLGPSL